MAGKCTILVDSPHRDVFREEAIETVAIPRVDDDGDLISVAQIGVTYHETIGLKGYCAYKVDVHVTMPCVVNADLMKRTAEWAHKFAKRRALEFIEDDVRDDERTIPVRKSRKEA